MDPNTIEKTAMNVRRNLRRSMSTSLARFTGLTPKGCGWILLSTYYRKCAGGYDTSGGRIVERLGAAVRPFLCMPSTAKTLHRSRGNRMIAGVCGGLAEWLGWDATLVRVLYVIVSVLSVAFPGILVYVLLWVLMPERQAA